MSSQTPASTGPQHPTPPVAPPEAAGGATSAGRYAPLDILRTLAVVLVMFRHSAMAPGTYPGWLQSVLNTLLSCGWFGVDLFFVLSGFLISGLLFSEYRARGGVNIGRFLVRRGFKIYPAFYFFLLVSVLVERFVYGAPVNLTLQPGSPRQLWPELAFMQSYFWAYWNHTWSLAVEEHFYILLPIILGLLAWLNRRFGEEPGRPVGFRPLPVVFLLVLLGAFLWRAEAIQRWPFEVDKRWFQIIRHMTPSHMRLDSLFVGVMLGYGYHFHRAMFLRLGVALAPGLLIGAAAGIAFGVRTPLDSAPMIRWGFPILAFSFAALIWSVLSLDQSRWGGRVKASVFGRVMARPAALCAYIGRHSYSIYLWHIVAADWGTRIAMNQLGLKPGTPDLYLVRLLCVTVGACAIGILAAKLVENPVLRLRDRLFPSRSRAVIAPGS